MEYVPQLGQFYTVAAQHQGRCARTWQQEGEQGPVELTEAPIYRVVVLASVSPPRACVPLRLQCTGL